MHGEKWKNGWLERGMTCTDQTNGQKQLMD